MNSDLHNDLLPLVFAAIGVYLAFLCGRAPMSAWVALAIQAFVPAGFWVHAGFC